MEITFPQPPDVFIVDDSAVFVHSVIRILTEYNRFRVCGTFSQGVGADSAVLNALPDILLIDMEMPDKTGIDVIKDIRKSNKDIRILTLSVCEEGTMVANAIKAGANGYISKLHGIENLIIIMEKLLKGETYFTDGAILLAAS